MELEVEQFSSDPFDSLGESFESLVGCLKLVIPFRLWMVTRVSGEDWNVLYADDQEGQVKKGSVFRWSDSYCSKMVKGQGPRFAPHAQAIDAYRKADINRVIRIGAYIGQPLTSSDGEVLGTLCAIDPLESIAFTKAQIQIVESITRTMSTLLSVWMKLDKARQAEAKLHYLAHTDALTGLANRHAWNLLIDEEEKAVSNLGENVLIMVADLDGLKQANDRFGHAQGDDCLRKAATALSWQFRDTDLVARTGGDEFAVFIRSGVKTAIPAIRDRVSAALAIVGVEASIGFASRLDHHSLQETVDAADRSMYEEKQQRRARMGGMCQEKGCRQMPAALTT